MAVVDGQGRLLIPAQVALALLPELQHLVQGEAVGPGSLQGPRANRVRLPAFPVVLGITRPAEAPPRTVTLQAATRARPQSEVPAPRYLRGVRGKQAPGEEGGGLRAM